MKIGTLELIVIAIVALLVIGPNKLPEYAKKLGLAMREFKKATNSLSKEIKENIVEPLDEVQKPLKDAVAPLTEMEKEIKGSIKEVTNSVNNIGKPQKAAHKAEENKEPAEPSASDASDTIEKENPQ